MSKYKVIIVTRSDVTALKVSSGFNIEKASDEEIRDLLINTTPEPHMDRVDLSLEIEDNQHIGPHKHTRYFNQEDL